MNDIELNWRKLDCDKWINEINKVIIKLMSEWIIIHELIIKLMNESIVITRLMKKKDRLC